MKKLAALVVLGVIAMSCSQKPDNSIQDSNVMLEEPEVKVIATENAAAPVAEAPVATPVDSTATK